MDNNITRIEAALASIAVSMARIADMLESESAPPDLGKWFTDVDLEQLNKPPAPPGMERTGSSTGPYLSMPLSEDFLARLRSY